MPAEAGPSISEEVAEATAAPPQPEAEARPDQLEGVERPQRPSQPLSRPSAPPQLRRKPAQAAAVTRPATEAPQATEVVAPEPGSTAGLSQHDFLCSYPQPLPADHDIRGCCHWCAVGGREEEAVSAAPSTSEPVEGVETVASGRQQLLSSQPTAEQAVELPTPNMRGPPPRRVLPRSNTLNLFQRDLRAPLVDSFSQG